MGLIEAKKKPGVNAGLFFWPLWEAGAVSGD
jgi:hypothetical protein